MTDTVEGRLRQLGLELPSPLAFAGPFVGAQYYDGMVFLSGHGPFADGQVVFTGKVGLDVDVDAARAAARLAVLNLLSTLKATVHELERVAAVLKLTVFVSSAPGFTDQHLVANAASDIVVGAFGESIGSHARSAVGTAVLPFDMSVEIEAVCSYRT